jgi:post-segregation antitoxin (ccd killing protein)
MTNITTISVSDDLLQRARELKINVSEISRIALKREIGRLKKEPHRFDLRDDR